MANAWHNPKRGADEGTRRPRRTSLMFDWSPSEFSRWRLQFTDDRSQQGVRDGQIYLQYLMSLGSHGAHSY